MLRTAAAALASLCLTTAATAQSPDAAERARLSGMAAGYAQAWTQSKSHALAYLLADTHARLGDRDQALKWLTLAAAGPFEIMPPPLSALWRYRDDPAFAEVFAALRARHRPTANGARLFTLPHGAGPLEGVAYDPDTRQLFVSDMAARHIMAVSPEGQYQPFATDLELRPLGLKVDASRRRLWAATTNLFAAIEPEKTALVRFDLATGERRTFTAPGARTFNDLAVAPNGDVFVTDTEGGGVWRLREGADALEPLVPAGTYFLPNGIAIDDAGKLLFVAQGASLHRIDIATGETRRLTAPPTLDTVGTDGLYFRDGALVAVQNLLTPGRILRLVLNPDRTAIEAVEVTDNGHPDFNTPTTGTFDGDRFLVLANAQVARLLANGEVDGVADPAVILCYDVKAPAKSRQACQTGTGKEAPR